jgi:hypothetical protein
MNSPCHLSTQNLLLLIYSAPKQRDKHLLFPQQPTVFSWHSSPHSTHLTKHKNMNYKSGKILHQKRGPYLLSFRKTYQRFINHITACMSTAVPLFDYNMSINSFSFSSVCPIPQILSFITTLHCNSVMLHVHISDGQILFFSDLKLLS